MPACPECNTEMGRLVAVQHKPSTRVEHYFCGECMKLRKAFARRNFDLEDREKACSWGPLFWDLGILPRENPFSREAA